MPRYGALLDGIAGAYGVIIPDLTGCTSAGVTSDEALRHAVEAIRLWAEDARMDGETLPKARAVEDVRADPAVADALAEGAALALVPLVLDRGQAAEADRSLDKGLQAALDEGAERPGAGEKARSPSASPVQGTEAELPALVCNPPQGGSPMSDKRELISPNGDKRFVRRDAEGKFKESDDVGRSLSQDVRQHAKHEVKSGQGDKGDRKRR